MNIKLPEMFIGIYGAPGAGKSTFAKLMCSLFAEKGITSGRYKMSDWAKKQLQVINVDPNRENTVWISSIMIEKNGLDYWVNCIAQDLKKVRQNVKIIETGWCFEEMLMFKDKLKPNIILVFVNTPLEQNIYQIKNRTPTEKEESELIYLDKVLKKFDMRDVAKTADYIIENNGSVGSLVKKAHIITRFIIAEHGEESAKNRASSIIVKGNQVLLVHRRKLGYSYYVFPGGRIEENETPLLACLRETKEETGLEIHTVREIGCIDVGKRMEHFFLVESFQGVARLGEPELSRNSSENEYNLAWMNISELRKIPIKPGSVLELLKEIFREN